VGDQRGLCRASPTLGVSLKDTVAGSFAEVQSMLKRYQNQTEKKVVNKNQAALD
jgi:hypothetical protein